MSRVLITGGAGFIGQHLVAHFVERGDRVTVLDDLSSGDRSAVPDAAELIVADIADPAVVAELRHVEPELVVHAAAQVKVVTSMQDPDRDLRVNVMGTRHVLAAAGEARVVFISTGGALYGETEGADETHPIDPTSYYGVHKWTAERHVMLSARSHAVARLANVYGPGQRAGLEGGVVAIFVDHARSGEPITIFGDGEQRRDFVHVSDVVAAVSAMAAHDGNGTWNIGSGRATSVNELADLVGDLAGRHLERRHVEARAGELRSSVLVVDRACQDLGWEPRVRLREGVAALLS